VCSGLFINIYTYIKAKRFEAYAINYHSVRTIICKKNPYVNKLAASYTFSEDISNLECVWDKSTPPIDSQNRWSCPKHTNSTVQVERSAPNTSTQPSKWSGALSPASSFYRSDRYSVTTSSPLKTDPPEYLWIMNQTFPSAAYMKL
jgi:hypothetical protein